MFSSKLPKKNLHLAVEFLIRQQKVAGFPPEAHTLQ